MAPPRRRKKSRGTKLEIKRDMGFDEWTDKAHKDKQDEKLSLMEQFEKTQDDKDADDDYFFENKRKPEKK